MSPDTLEFLKNLLLTVRPEFEKIYRGIDPMTLREKPHVWPDPLDLLDHGVHLIQSDGTHPIPAEITKVVCEAHKHLSFESGTPLALSQEKS